MHSNSKISSVRQLQEISRKMEEIQEHQGMRRFVEAGSEAKTISGFVDDIRDAILEYQVSCDGPACSNLTCNSGVVANVPAQTEQHADCEFDF